VGIEAYNTDIVPLISTKVLEQISSPSTSPNDQATPLRELKPPNIHLEYFPSIHAISCLIIQLIRAIHRIQNSKNIQE
jgi:hypothetical protein